MVRYRESDISPEEPEQFDRDLPGYEFLPRGFPKPCQFALNSWVEPEHFIGHKTPHSMIDDWSRVFEPAENHQALAPGHRPSGAFGLSGSPVWRLGASGRSTTEWTPEASRLVGIVTNWNPDHKVLIATSAARLLELGRTETKVEA